MADAQSLVQCAENESHPHVVVYTLTGLEYLPLLSALIPFCTLSCQFLRPVLQSFYMTLCVGLWVSLPASASFLMLYCCCPLPLGTL